MSIWLKNEVEKLAVRVAALEDRLNTVQPQPIGQTQVDKTNMDEVLYRLQELENQAHTHNFGPKKKA